MRFVGFGIYRWKRVLCWFWLDLLCVVVTLVLLVGCGLCVLIRPWLVVSCVTVLALLSLIVRLVAGLLKVWRRRLVAILVLVS